MMTRPGPTLSERTIQSDLLVVRPYATGVVVMGVAALCANISIICIVKDLVAQGVLIGAVSLFATQVIGYLLILAKQVETTHRLNSRMDELLEASGHAKYIAGKEQGHLDADEIRDTQ